MKTTLYIGLLLIVAGIFYLLGLNSNTNHQEVSNIPTPNQDVLDLESAIKNYPRGTLNIPAQWFIMDTMVGAEKMILIFGYADNKSVCEHMLKLAKEETPIRNFRCEDAN